MKDPVIIFCEKGHIYDAALNEECPYCKKINMNTEKLNSVLGNENIEKKHYSSFTNEADETELLIEDDDKTEMLEPDESEETEMLIPENEAIDSDDRKKDVETIHQYTHGWLVCISGSQKGESYVLSDYNILFCSDNNAVKRLHIEDDSSEKNRQNASAEIIVNQDGLFYITPINDSKCLVGGKRIESKTPIYAYDSIEICEIKYMFIPLVGNQFRWE